MPETDEEIRNPETDENREETHSALEADLENQLSALRAEMEDLKRENRQMFLRLTGRDGEEKDPEDELDEILLEVLNHNGRNN